MGSAAVVRERIVRVPHGDAVPEGWKFVQLLGQESIPYAPFLADVILVSKDFDAAA